MNHLIGFEIVEDPTMLQDGLPVSIRRTWWKRLFTRPWNPFKEIEIVKNRVPSTRIIKKGNRLIMHPVMAEKVRHIDTSKDDDIYLFRKT